MIYDVLIIGGGIYGLYCANFLSKRNKRVLLIDIDNSLFSRASYVNQARLHNGYHYPRSYETANIAQSYYDKFKTDFRVCINDVWEHIYAVSTYDSLTTDMDFINFCNRVNIPLSPINPSKYFINNTVNSAYKVEECAFDYKKLCKHLIENNKFDIHCNTSIKSVKQQSDKYVLSLSNNQIIECECIINTTYASINQINKLFGYSFIDMKYELCEMILCESPNNLKDKGITIVDGHYFSIMPFGLQNHHSLYSVEHSVHETSWDNLPKFSCQHARNTCSPNQLNNCNMCYAKPLTAFSKMYKLTKQYLIDSNIKYLNSIYTVKVVSKHAEQSDARLVSIEEHNKSPRFLSFFSGKISSIYELDYTLQNI